MTNLRAENQTLPPLFGPMRALALAAGVLAAACLLVFARVLFCREDRVLSLWGHDLYTVFVGWAQFCYTEMRQGNLPLWNPHVWAGAPCLGGFQEALLYPPTWIHLIPAVSLAQAFNWEIILHVFLAGLFVYAWAARRGMQMMAAIVAGLTFMFGGGYFMHISAGHLPNLRTIAWAPLLFLAIDDLTTTRSLRGAWLGALSILMQILAGHLQYTYFLALVAIPYALVRLGFAPDRRRALLGLAMMGVGGAMLSAVQLFPGLQAASESLRTRLGYEVASTFAFPPENLLTLVFPDFFGTLGDGSGGPGTNYYWGRWYLWEDSLFIGTAALILVVYGIVRGNWRQWIGPLVIIAISLVVAFGYYTPIFRLLYQWMPGFASFRGVSKFAFLAALFLSLLAGYGMDLLLRERRIAVWPACIFGACAVVLIAIGMIVGHSSQFGGAGSWGRLLAAVNWADEGYRFGPMASGPPDRAFFETSAGGVTTSLYRSAGALLAMAIIWLAATRDHRGLRFVPLVVGIELIWFAMANQPTFFISRSTPPDRDTPMVDRLPTVMEQEASFHANIARINQWMPDSRVATGQPAIIMGAGDDDAWGNDPMVLRRYAQFMTHSLGETADQIVRDGSFYKLAPTGNARYPLLPSNPSPLWAMVRLRGIWVPTGQGQTTAWPVPGPQLARALLVDDARVVADPVELLEQLSRNDFDPRRTALLEQRTDIFPEHAQSPSPERPGYVELNDRNSDQIEVTAQINRPCILLITDNFSSGWRVDSLDEHPPQKYQVVRTDYTLRGIPLSPGKHHFDLVYAPIGYTIGKWVSAASLIVFGLAAIRLWGRRAARGSMEGK